MLVAAARTSVSVHPSEDALVLEVTNFVHVGLLGEHNEAFTREAGGTPGCVLTFGTEHSLKILNLLFAVFEDAINFLIIKRDSSTAAASAFSRHIIRPARLLCDHSVLGDVLVALLFHEPLNETLLLLVFVVLLRHGVKFVDIEGRRDVDNLFSLNLILLFEVGFDLFLHTFMRVVIEFHVLTHNGEVRVRVRLQVQLDRHLEESATNPDEHEQVDEDSETEETADPRNLVHALIGLVVTDSNCGSRVVDPNTNREDVEELVARIRIFQEICKAKCLVALVPK